MKWKRSLLMPSSPNLNFFSHESFEIPQLFQEPQLSPYHIANFNSKLKMLLIIIKCTCAGQWTKRKHSMNGQDFQCINDRLVLSTGRGASETVIVLCLFFFNQLNFRYLFPSLLHVYWFMFHQKENFPSEVFNWHPLCNFKKYPPQSTLISLTSVCDCTLRPDATTNQSCSR